MIKFVFIHIFMTVITSHNISALTEDFIFSWFLDQKSEGLAGSSDYGMKTLKLCFIQPELCESDVG